MLAAIVAGCGGGGEETAGSSTAGRLGGGGAVAWAVAGSATTLDPLFATNAAERLVSRQIHEPLVEELTGPFEDPRRVPGLALSVSVTSDPTVWRAKLRPGVRFGDGAPLDARAVLANAERWQAFPEQSGLAPPPQLFVFSPKPDEVRFKLAAPDPSFGAKLGSPRLGLVSPAALRRAGGAALGSAQIAESGTGPFELRESDTDSLLLASNADWWGTERGLGPGVDQLEFVYATPDSERLALLEEGSVQVADDLGPRALRAAAGDPLLSVIERPGAAAIAAERSVRGIPTEEPVPSLNGVWLTQLVG